jgi:hypothetical protein
MERLIAFRIKVRVVDPGNKEPSEWVKGKESTMTPQRNKFSHNDHTLSPY